MDAENSNDRPPPPRQRHRSTTGNLSHALSTSSNLAHKQNSTSNCIPPMAQLLNKENSTSANESFSSRFTTTTNVSGVVPNNQMLVSHKNSVSKISDIHSDLGQKDVSLAGETNSRGNIISVSPDKCHSSSVRTSSVSSNTFISSSSGGSTISESQSNSCKSAKYTSNILQGSAISSVGSRPSVAPINSSISPSSSNLPSASDISRGPPKTYQIQAQVHTSPYQTSIHAKATSNFLSHTTSAQQSNSNIGTPIEHSSNSIAAKDLNLPNIYRNSSTSIGVNNHQSSIGKSHSSQLNSHNISQSNPLHSTYQNSSQQSMPHQTQSLSSSQLSAMASHPCHQISPHSNPNLHSCHNTSTSPGVPHHSSGSHFQQQTSSSAGHSINTPHPAGLTSYPACNPYNAQQQTGGSSSATVTGSSSTTLNGDLTPRGPCRGDLGDERSPKSSISHLSLLSASFPCRLVLYLDVVFYVFDEYQSASN